MFKVGKPTLTPSGREGLRLLLETSGLKPDSDILMPGYTFGLLCPTIRASGFNPVAVDVDPATFQMEAKQAEKAVTSRTVAVIATHIFGEPCDIASMREMTNKYGLILVEDCAQALGAKRNGRCVGGFGDAGFASFDISKPLQGIRGGVVFGSDEEWMDRVRKKNADLPVRGGFKREFLKGYLEHVVIQSCLWRIFMLLFSNEALQSTIVSLYRKRESGNDAPGFASNMAYGGLPDQAAMMIRMNLATLSERRKRRLYIRDLYKKELDDVLIFQKTREADEGSVHLLVARAKGDLFKLRGYLALHGVDIAVGAEIADDCLKMKDSATETIFKEAVALPVQENLTYDDVLYITNLIKSFYRAKKRN